MGKTVVKLSVFLLISNLILLPILIIGTPKLNPTYLNRVYLSQNENYTPMEQIHIWSNDDFANFNFPGSGFEGDPYRIEGYEITTSEDDLIFISNTDVYFIIRDNLLLGDNSDYQFGIRLNNVQNGLIEDNIITSANNNGVQFDYSENIVFSNNVVNNNENWGIYLHQTSNIQFYANLISSNGFEGVGSYNSYNNYWANNTIIDHDANGVRFEITDSTAFVSNILSGNGEAGIWLGEAHNNTIRSNQFLNNGVGVAISHDDVTRESTDNLIIQNEINGNSNGIFIWDGVSNNITNNLIERNEAKGIIIQDGSDNTFNHNTISEHIIGIDYSGGSYRNQVQCNSISSNGIGIRLVINLGYEEENTRNKINYNILEDNLAEGVFIGSGNYILAENNDFIENQIIPQASDSGTNNQFAQNYWSDIGDQDQNEDGINDFQYAISGFGNNNDAESSPARNVDVDIEDSFCNLDQEALGLIVTIITTQSLSEPKLEFPINSSILLIIPILGVLSVGTIIFYQKKLKLSSVDKFD